MRRRAAMAMLALLTAALAAQPGVAGCNPSGTVPLALEAPKSVGANEAVSLQITVAPRPGAAVRISDASGQTVGNVVAYGPSEQRTYSFVLPHVTAGETLHLTAKVSPMRADRPTDTSLCILHARLMKIPTTE